MKKLYFIAAIALVMASCTSEEEVGGQKAISFGGVVKKTTRAQNSLMQSGQLPDTYDLHVAALVKSTATGATWQNFFDKANATDPVGVALYQYGHGGVAGNWGCDAKTYYYPSAGTIAFLAYSAEGKNPAATFTTSGTEGFKTLQLTFDDLDGTIDAMCSSVANVTCKPASYLTNLYFKHLLSWIVLRFSGSTQSEIKLYSVKLKSVALNGTVNIDVTDNETIAVRDWTQTGIDDIVVPDFVPEDTDNNGEIDKDEAIALEDIDDNSVCGIAVVPGNQTKIEIVYSMASNNHETKFTHVIDLDTAGDVWNPGQRYVYNISFGLTGITFKANALNWDEDDEIPEEVN